LYMFQRMWSRAPRSYGAIPLMLNEECAGRKM